MAHQYAKTMFTEEVRSLQERHHSRTQYARMEEHNGARNELGYTEVEHIAQRDSFYMASVNADGWPYVQHRGGPKGFLRVLDERHIAFADFSGNKQYITIGNWATNDKISLFLMDYPNRVRLKIAGHARTIEADDPEFNVIEPQVRLNGYKAKTERIIVIEIIGFDWNCSQHITPRWTKDEMEAAYAASSIAV